MGVAKGGAGTLAPWILKNSAKKFFFNFEWEKTNFTTFGTPWKNFGKILPTPMLRSKIFFNALIASAVLGYFRCLVV